MFSSFLAIAHKEFLHALRTPGIYRTILIFQIIQMTMLGYVDLTTRDLPVAIIDLDRSSHSRELVDRINATRALKVKYVAARVEDGRELVRAGRVQLAVVIPVDYHQKRVLGSGATILALVDGATFASSGQALAVLTGLTTQMNVETQQASADPGKELPITTHSVTLFNPQGRAAFYLLPGAIAVLMLNFIHLSSQSLMRERMEGKMERLLMSPLSATGLLLGKVSPYMLIGFADLVLLLGAMRWVFDVPIRGSLVLLLVAGALFLITLLAIGIFLASGTSTAPEVASNVNLLFVLTVFLSGYIWPLWSLPKALLPVSYLLPPTHIIAITRGIAIRDASFLDLAPHFAYLVVAPTLIFTAAIARFRRAVQP